MLSSKYLVRIAILIFIVLQVFSTAIWLSNQEQRSEIPILDSTPISVAVADIEAQYVRTTQSISKGTIITADMLTYLKGSEAYDPPPTVFTDKAQVVGKLVKTDLPLGQVLGPDFIIDQAEWREVSAPVVVDDNIYFWSISGQLQAVDIENGQQIWQFIPPDTTINQLSIYSPLTISQETLYLFASHKRSVNLYALDVQTGQEKWRFERIGLQEDFPTTAPLVIDGTIYIINNHNELIQAVDAKTGQETWQFSPKSPVMSNLTISNDIIYFRDVNNNFYSVNSKTGEEQWQRKLESQ